LPDLAEARNCVLLYTTQGGVILIMKEQHP